MIKTRALKRKMIRNRRMRKRRIFNISYPEQPT
jgi:hypothetical protein